MIGVREGIRSMICRMLIFITSALIIVNCTGINQAYTNSSGLTQHNDINKNTVNAESNMSTKGSTKTSAVVTPNELWSPKDRILIVDMIDYATAMNMTNFPEYVTDGMKETIMQYAYKIMNGNHYDECTIIGMANDMSDNGVTAHFIFNDYQYLCIWFNNESLRYITIYDKLILDLPENMEKFIL